MEWEKAKPQDNGTVKIPSEWLHIHYFDALNVLFRTENSLRVFVYSILKNEFLNKWYDCQISDVEGESKTIKSIAKTRIEQAQGFGYLCYEINSPIMHLNSGELVRIITSKKYWPFFRTHFKGKQDIIKNKLDEINTVRNSLSHFRPIKEDDVELIKQNAKHVFMGIEEYLGEMILTNKLVPTNTIDAWHRELLSIGNEYCNYSCYQSKENLWIRIELEFQSIIVKNYTCRKNFISCEMLDIISPNILSKFTMLSKYLTSLSERVIFLGVSEDNEPSLKKNISFVFSKKVLDENYKEICNELKKLAALIIEESSLIQKDNLAMGSLVESKSAYAFYNSDNKSWKFSDRFFMNELKASHPEEYWADYEKFGMDIISKSKKYPWMTPDISQGEEIPF